MTVHAPKREVFDVRAGTNTDPKGIVRDVETYTEKPWGLYMARPAPGRAQFHYLESWVLPSLGLRVTVFHFNPGHEKDQDFYLDVGEYTRDGDRWVGVDHYLDLVLRTGRDVRIVDVDELLAAVAAGMLSPEAGERAVRVAVSTVEALARHDYDPHRWLAANGMLLTWRDE